MQPSYTANFAKLESFIFSLPRKPDIIAITETRVTPLNSDPYNDLYNYILVQNPRKSLKGGSVAFYIKNNIQFTVIDKLSIMKEKVFESISVKIELKHDTLTCGTIFRSPMTDSSSNQQFITNLSIALSHLKPNTKSMEILIMIFCKQKTNTLVNLLKQCLTIVFTH